MADVDAFALPRSDLNAFLFAEIGVETNGMTLSVLSALARAGVDPWQEAGRLAQLPRSRAAAALADVIADLPASLWPMAEAAAIAKRLVDLLPSGGRSPALARRVRTQPLVQRLVQSWGKPSIPGRAKPPATPKPNHRMSWSGAAVLAFMAILLVGLTVGLLGEGATRADSGRRPASHLAAVPLPRPVHSPDITAGPH